LPICLTTVTPVKSWKRKFKQNIFFFLGDDHHGGGAASRLHHSRNHLLRQEVEKQETYRGRRYRKTALR
jgi:hypothetical protein